MWPFPKKDMTPPPLTEGEREALKDPKVPEETKKLLEDTEENVKEKKYREKPGLRDYFSKGEVFPWKGMFLRVQEVNFDTMVLSYNGVTKKILARIEESKKNG